MWRRRELDKTLTHFENYLRGRGYRLSFEARLGLKEYMLEAKRRKSIGETLSRKEKTLGDVTVGFRRLADKSIKFAKAQNRTTVTTSDVMNAIAEISCTMWPFCNEE